jgi:hypothetical protein
MLRFQFTVLGFETYKQKIVTVVQYTEHEHAHLLANFPTLQ